MTNFDHLTLIAHRGANRYAPENTLAALSLAKELGATWIEFDVQLTQDDVAVVFHDNNLTRVGRLWHENQWQPINDQRSLFELPWSTIQQVNVGVWFKDLNPAAAAKLNLNAIRIALLTDYLQLAQSLDLSLNIELKIPDKLYAPENSEILISYRKQLLKNVLDALKEGQWPSEKIMLSSFDLSLVKMARDASPYYRLAALYWDKWPEDHFQFAIDLPCCAVNLHDQMLLNNPSPQGLQNLFRHQMDVNVYTVNTLDTAKRIIDIANQHGGKINGFFTDDLLAFIRKTTDVASPASGRGSSER